MSVAERRVREREARTELILKAALRVFARRGIKEATMDEIAQEAELGKGTIYYYFSSKEAILEELMHLTVDRHSDGILERVHAASTPLKIAEAIIDGFVDSYQKNPELFRLFYMALAQPCGLEGTLKLFAERHRQWLDALERETRAVLARSGISSKAFIDFIGTYIHGIVLLVAAGRDVEEIKRESLRTLRASLRTQMALSAPIQTQRRDWR